MYEAHFGLSEKPFSLNPDPDFLYPGPAHARALAMLEFGLVSETGVVVISGEVGSGKTTLLRRLLGGLDDSFRVGLITNTHESFGELIHWVSMAFDLPHEGRDKVALYDQFVAFMIAEYGAGRRVVIIVDEAQNMSAATLEELRVISNINAGKDCVLQLVLVGQPELKETLSLPELRQFVQRISAYYDLAPLDLAHTRRYIEHRLAHAGAKARLFDYSAIYLIFQNSGGTPRIINTLCHLGLTYAFGEGLPAVTGDVMTRVLEDRGGLGLFGAVDTTLPEDHEPTAAELEAAPEALAELHAILTEGDRLPLATLVDLDITVDGSAPLATELERLAEAGDDLPVKTQAGDDLSGDDLSGEVEPEAARAEARLQTADTREGSDTLLRAFGSGEVQGAAPEAVGPPPLMAEPAATPDNTPSTETKPRLQDAAEPSAKGWPVVAVLEEQDPPGIVERLARAFGRGRRG